MIFLADLQLNLKSEILKSQTRFFNLHKTKIYNILTPLQLYIQYTQ